MSADQKADALFYLLILILPLSALIARRAPVGSTLKMVAAWGAIFLILIVIVGQWPRIAPYADKAAAALNLNDQSVAGTETRIAMSSDGHFWARVEINGVPRRMLVDSGATLSALSTATARTAKIDLDESPFPVVIETANGRVSGRSATIGELRIGSVTAHDIGVVVAPEFGDTDVLGMNFLSKLASWRVEGRTLILTPSKT